MEADEEDEEEMKLILFCTLHKRRQDSRQYSVDGSQKNIIRRQRRERTSCGITES